MNGGRLSDSAGNLKPRYQRSEDDIQSPIGIDMGLKSFLIKSEGSEVPIPQYYRKAQKHLRKAQKRVSRKVKGSNNRRKAVENLGKAHKKVADTRKDFHFKTVKQITDNHDLIAFEKLSIKGLAKTRLAKSILDAGLLTVAVNPNGTSQNCSNCGHKVPKTLKDRVHSCPKCDYTADRDVNAAINILNLAVGHPVSSKAYRVTKPLGGVGKKPALYRSCQCREYVTIS